MIKWILIIASIPWVMILFNIPLGRLDRFPKIDRLCYRNADFFLVTVIPSIYGFGLAFILWIWS